MLVSMMTLPFVAGYSWSVRYFFEDEHAYFGDVAGGGLYQPSITPIKVLTDWTSWTARVQVEIVKLMRLSNLDWPK